MRSRLHLAALEYAAAGMPVFALRPGTKEPFGGSAGFKDATCDLAAVDRLWSEQPDANIGWEPGANGCHAIDIDDKHGHKGSESWAALCREIEIDPDTFTNRTPSGGAHKIYLGRCPPSAGRLGDGLDVRGDGGYVVLPPSALDIYDGAEYITVDRTPPKPQAAALLERLKPHERAERAKVVGLVWDSERALDAAKDYADRLIRQGDVPVAGTRNEHAFRFLARLHGLGLSEGAARETFENFLTRSGGAWPEPWPSPKIESQIARLWAGRTGDNPPGSELQPTVSESMALSPELAAFIEATKGARPGHGRFTFRTAYELLNMPPIEFFDAERRFYPRASDGMMIEIFGPTGHHKTNVLLVDLMDMMLAGAVVVYAAGEGANGLGIRLRAHLFARGYVDAKPLGGRLWEVAIPLAMSDADMTSFYQALRTLPEKPDVIVFDTAATALAGLDEDVRAAAHYTRNGSIGKLTEMFGATVIAVAHTGADRTRRRGGEAFKSNVDAQHRITASDDIGAAAVRMDCVKMKDGGAGHSAFFEIAYALGVPVPQRITERVYEVLTQTLPKLDPSTIGPSLAAIGAKGRADAVSSGQLAQQVIQHGPDWPPTEIEAAQNKAAVWLARHAGSFVGLNNHGSGEPLVWWAAG